MVYVAINNAAKKILHMWYIHTSRLYSLSSVHLGIGLLGWRVCACSVLLEIPNLFSKVPILVLFSLTICINSSCLTFWQHWDFLGF